MRNQLNQAPKFYRVLLGSVASLMLLLSIGCSEGEKSDLIEKVNVKFADNLETIRVSLIFSDRIKADFSGTFNVKTSSIDFGNLFVQPFTATQHFEIGFDLNTSILNEQDFARVDPTEFLPNGERLFYVPNPVFQVKSAKPVHEKFDLYGYVDVLGASWLGVAAIFNFLNDKNFPSGITLTHPLMKDDAGNYTVAGSIFGPTLNEDGSLKRAGGIAIFANIRWLVEHFQGGQSFDLVLGNEYKLSGPNKGELEGIGALWRASSLRDRFIEGMNNHGNL